MRLDLSVDVLNKESSRALYEQLVDELRDGLLKRVPVGEKIPTEDELMRLYNTSRSTVRRAVQDLVDTGLLVRRQGKGTFVSRKMPSIVHEMDSLVPFYETFKKYGEKPATRIVEMSWVSGNAIPEQIRGATDSALFFRQVYLSDEAIHVVADVFVVRSIGKELTRKALEKRPVFEMYPKLVGSSELISTFTVSCGPLPQNLISLMRLSPGAFALLLERDTKTSDGSVIDHAILYLRSDMYRLRTTLRT